MSPIETVRYLIEQAKAEKGTLTELQVPTEFMEELVRECAPKTPQEMFGIPIEVDPDLDDAVKPEATSQLATLH